MNPSIIGALRDYFFKCPLMGDNKINVDYLPEKGIEYSIDTVPATQIIKRYVNGDSTMQYLFVVRSVREYGSDVLQNLANSGFYEKLADWLSDQTSINNLPVLPLGKTATDIQAQSTGYLFTTSVNSGKYQIQCRLIYTQKKEQEIWE